MTTSLHPLPVNPDLADLRHATGMTVRQVGPLVGLSYARIVQFEKDGVALAVHIEKLARAYGVSEDDVWKANRRTKYGK